MELYRSAFAPSWGLKLVRRLRRLSREQLADAVFLPVELLTDYEQKRRLLPRERLLSIIGDLRLTVEERKKLLGSIPNCEPLEWRLAPPMEIPAPMQELIDEASVQTGERIREFATRRYLRGGDRDEITADIAQASQRAQNLAYEQLIVDSMILQAKLRERSRRPSPEDRTRGAERWARLETLNSSSRRLVVETARGFWTWDLCEKLGEESQSRLDRAPEVAAELADLAVYIAKRVPGERPWRCRLRGFALACSGNARLAKGDQSGAEITLAEALRCWAAGEKGDPGLLDETPLRRLASCLSGASAPTPHAGV